MDKLETNRATDYYCGNGISFEVVAPYIVRKAGEDKTPKIAICSDREVSGYYYNRFEEQFIKLGIKPYLITVDSRTNFKGLVSSDVLLKSLVDFDFGTDDWLISFGGGGVLDICGFVSSIFNCGINFMAVPTTLNSMIDGVLASHSYLNSSGHKNEIRVPFECSVAVLDPIYLNTVPPKVRTGGYASIIRLSLLGNLELLENIAGPKDFRTYINDIYKTRMEIEKKDPLLLTLGDELAQSIESYFRFMNYSEGEALALSLLSSVNEGRKRPLVAIYNALKLPTVLEGCTEKMIRKTLNEQLAHRGEDKIKMVDLDGGKWKVFEYETSEAEEILSSRIKKILNEES